MPCDTVPDKTLHVIARDDDYFFGVLHSHAHEVWSLTIGNTLEDRPRYNSAVTFGTFPFPYPPGSEPAAAPDVKAIVDAARKLVELRDKWLNPEGASPAELKTRTLTNLYNQRPTWLQNAHRALDDAVFAAYGWTQINAAGKALPEPLADDEILARLLALNHARAG